MAILKDYQRVEKIKRYKEQGITLTEIGKFFGISRQRVYQILTDYRSPYHGSKKHQDYKNKWRKKNVKKNRKKK